MERPRDETGKRRQAWHSKEADGRRFTTRREAERAKVELLSQHHAGTYVDHPHQTLSDFMEDWFPTIERTVRPSTLESYKRNVRLHVLPHIAGVHLHQLDAGTLNGLYAQLLRGGRDDGQGLSPRSVHYVATILHRALRDAVLWGRMIRNPADAADPPRRAASAAREMQTWTPTDPRRFLELSASTDDRYFPAWQ